MKRRFLCVASAVAYFGSCTNVWAQAFLADPRVTDGLGVKTGDFELHPGVSAEGGYDSNYFQRSGTGLESPTIDAYRLRITPSLDFETLGRRTGAEGAGAPPPVALNGRLAASYNALWAADSHYSDQVSKQNHVAGNAGLGLDILPERSWSGDISGDYSRTVEASNDPDTSNAFRRDTVRGAAGIIWRPGGGLFKWRLGYQVTAQLFEDGGYQYLNNLQHQINTEGQWKFFPRTAIVYRGQLTWVDFTHSNPGTLTDGSTVRTEVGLNGLITNYFGLLVLGGWGATFFGNRGQIPAENYDSWIGQAELTWFPSPQTKLPEGQAPVGLSSVSIGYHRDFNISYLGDYYQRDRGYLNTTYFFGEKFVLALVGGLSHITRPQSYFPDGTPQANSAGGENRVDAVAFLEYRPTNSLGINTTFRYDAELTKKPVAVSEANPGLVDDLEFKRYQIYLGLRWFL